MPEMKPNRGTVSFGFPVEFFVVQVIGEIKDNFVNIPKAMKCVVERSSRNENPNSCLGIQPAFHLAAIIAKHGWFFITFVKTEWAARLETTARWEGDQTWRLTGDEHRVRITAQARDARHQHLRVWMKRRREE